MRGFWSIPVEQKAHFWLHLLVTSISILLRERTGPKSGLDRPNILYKLFFLIEILLSPNIN